MTPCSARALKITCDSLKLRKKDVSFTWKHCSDRYADEGGVAVQSTLDDECFC